MNLKTFVAIIIGVSLFLGVYLFSMFSALALLVGFGLGIWQHSVITNLFKNYQRGIYLSEKNNMANRKKELEAELEKLNLGD
jgi:hypothetical protein